MFKAGLCPFRTFANVTHVVVLNVCYRSPDFCLCVRKALHLGFYASPSFFLQFVGLVTKRARRHSIQTLSGCLEASLELSFRHVIFLLHVFQSHIANSCFVLPNRYARAIQIISRVLQSRFCVCGLLSRHDKTLPQLYLCPLLARKLFCNAEVRSFVSFQTGLEFFYNVLSDSKVRFDGLQ